MTGIFITSTGTDTGKTLVTCAMIHQAHRQGVDVHAIKPVASGMNLPNTVSDATRLLRAMGSPQHPSVVKAICPWQFDRPVSPHLAARAMGKQIDWNVLVAYCKESIAAHALTLIEGAGGLMSPLDDLHTNLDLVKALDIPLVLVVSNYLGAISHNLTALETINAHHLHLAGMVISAAEKATVEEKEMRRLLQLKLNLPRPILWIDRLSDDIENYKTAPNLESLWNNPPNL